LSKLAAKRQQERVGSRFQIRVSQLCDRLLRGEGMVGCTLQRCFADAALGGWSRQRTVGLAWKQWAFGSPG
jgi:hypothetical protein